MILSLTLSQKQNGIIAFSSGNHAQGVAAAAKILGIDATIVMPSDAPNIKIENTKRDGATIVFYERAANNRVDVTNQIIKKTGATLIPPYDAPEIIAGQGTIGIEFIKQVKSRGVDLDLLLAPCSGGGLISGNAICFHSLSPKTKIYCVEPEGYDDTALSLRSGKRVEIKPIQTSICDALLLETPGKLTFEINKKYLAGGLIVTEKETEKAIRTAFRDYKIVCEPSGAVALAAVISNKIQLRKKNIGIICSGGNVNSETFSAILDRD